MVLASFSGIFCKECLQNAYRGIWRRFYKTVPKITAGCCKWPVLGSVWEFFGALLTGEYLAPLTFLSAFVDHEICSLEVPTSWSCLGSIWAVGPGYRLFDIIFDSDSCKQDLADGNFYYSLFNAITDHITFLLSPISCRIWCFCNLFVA